MKKPKAAAFDARAWAKGKAHGVSRGCGTCAQPAIVSAVRDVLEVMAAGEGRPSVRMIRGMLAERLGYGMSEAALRKHIVECEGPRWRAAHGAG